MATSSWLATWLDWDFLEQQRGARILPPKTDRAMEYPDRPGIEVANELAGRKLLRYMTPAQVGTFRSGTTAETYVTPTAYTADEAPRWLVLPVPTISRPYALILDPAQIPWIQGPMWVAAIRGMQYILPYGFPAEAIVVPGAPDLRWEVEVTEQWISSIILVACLVQHLKMR
jgi:hypothetical protein